MKKAHIISIGNELLIGDTVNTNASWLGGLLTEQGFYVEQVSTIPDSYDLIFGNVKSSLVEAKVTIVTGGLGPTHDDITKKVMVDLFDTELIENNEVLDFIKSIFKRRGFEFSRSNAAQAWVPKNCDVLFNNKGTAPGMWFEEQGNILVVLPGVPTEMKFLMEERVIPKLHEKFPDREAWATQYFKTSGVPESTLSDHIGDLNEFENNGVGVAYLPGVSGVTIRISANGLDVKQAEGKLETLKNYLYDKVGAVIFGEGKNLTLEAVTGKLLSDNKLTIATAESCTGGLLSSKITDIPGSSVYMKGGIVAYANEIKEGFLKVSKKDLEKSGAVSKIVALQMAKGVAEAMNADIGVSATGIAGPDGGTPDKPVGTVWMGFWIKGDHFALKTVLSNDRLLNKERTVMIILETIRRRLLKLEELPYQLKPQTV
ncbi:competence/damage-inducible protein A [Rhodohalobacter barkolensis]|uniref:CinA-like protein n=1 Tax=Rhodohalobacter barkolensis TaxID=2053187 RepID=A0A2N0VF62_9BACT|nr:competence/damage-inducible protein A [Rhodohalobacter barkolensis]PKD42827.1 competence/damage-inducible protein A [Rhodohalobacter barkolensis]